VIPEPEVEGVALPTPIVVANVERPATVWFPVMVSEPLFVTPGVLTPVVPLITTVMVVPFMRNMLR